MKLLNRHMPPPEMNLTAAPDVNLTPKPVFHTIDGMTSIFQNAGFGQIQIIEEARDYYYTEDEWRSELFTVFGRKNLDRFSPEGLERFKDDVYNELRKLKGENGIHKNVSVLMSYGVK